MFIPLVPRIVSIVCRSGLPYVCAAPLRALPYISISGIARVWMLTIVHLTKSARSTVYQHSSIARVWMLMIVHLTRPARSTVRARIITRVFFHFFSHLIIARMTDYAGSICGERGNRFHEVCCPFRQRAAGNVTDVG
jgi:hypothetical protein